MGLNYIHMMDSHTHLCCVQGESSKRVLRRIKILWSSLQPTSTSSKWKLLKKNVCMYVCVFHIWWNAMFIAVNNTKYCLVDTGCVNCLWSIYSFVCIFYSIIQFEWYLSLAPELAYEVVTVGCPTAYSLKYRHGGLIKWQTTVPFCYAK